MVEWCVFEISNQQLQISNWGKTESHTKELLKVDLFEMSFVHIGKSKSCTFLFFGQILCKGVVKGFCHWVFLNVI
jgi:hypothetical protein